VAGALLSFIGTAILIAGNGLTLPQGSALTGFALALLAALTWALYSTLSRRLGRIPTASVAVFCLLTSALSGAFHLMLEPTVWPADAAGWASVAALGLGPVGLAFYVWDIGMKRGDIQLLGVASYAAPLLSTLVVVAGVAAPSARLALAALLVTAGAALAAFSSARVRARSN
jgi:drug/metabolite transporter (DMT)-like permease